jgi:hypothetical protein
MAALYQYSNWVTIADLEARLVRLRLHIDEVSAKLLPDTNANGISTSNSALVQYHQNLMGELTRLESSLGAGTAAYGVVSQPVRVRN